MKKTICVFCGARDGIRPIYREQAILLGKILAQNNIRLVYGGASIGLMGAVAEGALEAGGEVVGIIPTSILDLEVAATNLSEQIVVSDMHTRKQKMHELSDAFICMPGGMGTLDEFFETATWKQLQYHQKPIGFLNTDGFYDPLFTNLNHMVTEGFVSPVDISSITIESSPLTLFEKMETKL